jgi:uncharacterized protein
MKIHDQIYGTIDIQEPVLKALLASRAIQRLKGVQQHGISGVIGLTQPITRYDHSLGTLILVRSLGGSLAEQIAAMLHDVSHTAFSHVIDYVIGDHDGQGYHDEVKEAYVRQTDLPALLQEYDYDWQALLDENTFSLLEQPSPRLCADRIDYFLRDSIALNLATREDVERVLQHLTVHDGRIVTNAMSVAQWLAYTYIAADKASWANLREVALYEVTARAIRRALQIKHINTDDFWKTDEALWALLHRSNDQIVKEQLALVSLKTTFVWDEENPTFRVSTKLRSIDPDVLLSNGQCAPLSALDEEFRAFRIAYHRQREGAWPIRVIAPNTRM